MEISLKETITKYNVEVTSGELWSIFCAVRRMAEGRECIDAHTADVFHKLKTFYEEKENK